MPKFKKIILAVIPVVFLLLSFFIPKNCFAQKFDKKQLENLDKDQLNKLAGKYFGSKNSGKSKSKPEDRIKKMIELKPENRFIESSEPELSNSDKMYITMHMKLANKHFKKKEYDKAESEISNVLARQPSHGGAHFMKAVISARKKQYNKAWYYILIAKDKDSNQAKISSFISKLSTVLKEPTSPSWVKGIYRGIPSSACDKYCDIIESFLKTQTSQYVSSIAIKDFTDSNKASIPITIIFIPNAPDSNEIKKAFQDSSNVSITGDSVSGNKWTATFNISDLQVENANAVPIKDLKYFIEEINEDIDVAINDTEELEPNGDTMEVKYKISVRTFSVLNDFLRTISPYAKKYIVSDITLGTVGNSVIWKTAVSVVYRIK